MKLLLLLPLIIMLMFVGGFSIHAQLAPVSVSVGSSVPGCDITNQCYTPYEITIDVGDNVIWSNDDSAAHTVTSGTPAEGPDGNFDSSLFMAGGTFSVTLDEAGEYPYFCMVHPWMTGIVIVDDTKSNSKCGAGTVFDYDINSCILIKIPSEAEEAEIIDEIFEFDIRKDRYVAREPIFIDGYVQYINHPSHINIRILDGNNQLVENVYVLPAKDNYFFYHTKSLPSWELDMTYTVRVTYDMHTEKKYFDLVNHSKDYDPQSVESLQTKLAKALIKNNNLLQQIEELKQHIIQKEVEMENMFCYKIPVS